MQRLLARFFTLGNAAGLVRIVLPALRSIGWSSLGAILGSALVVCSRFGDLPNWINWTQRLGVCWYLGIGVGTLLLLLAHLAPSGQRAPSFFAFSPAVWGAYLSTVLGTLAFRFSSLPRRAYTVCQRIKLPTWVLIPVFVVVAELLGNILDGATMISLSAIIFFLAS